MPLLIRIDLIPGGSLEASREIGRMVITNDGSHPDRPEYGNYKLALTWETTSRDHTVELAGDARDVKRDLSGLRSPFEFLQRILEQMDLMT